MSAIASLPHGQLIAAAKGAPETIKNMLKVVPEGYDETYKYFTRRGSRVLALGMKNMDPMPTDKVMWIFLHEVWSAYNEVQGQQTSSRVC